jgi:hypothetical protein
MAVTDHHVGPGRHNARMVIGGVLQRFRLDSCRYTAMGSGDCQCMIGSPSKPMQPRMQCHGLSSAGTRMKQSRSAAVTVSPSTRALCQCALAIRVTGTACSSFKLIVGVQLTETFRLDCQ